MFVSIPPSYSKTGATKVLNKDHIVAVNLPHNKVDGDVLVEFTLSTPIVAEYGYTNYVVARFGLFRERDEWLAKYIFDNDTAFYGSTIS